MSTKPRSRSAPARRRVASQDLQRSLERKVVPVPEADLPPQAPPFLDGLPKPGEPYDPRQPATKALKGIIEANGYAEAFEDAIEAVSEQGVPELADIRELDQFYYYLDALVTWIPEIRVWEGDDEELHERTVYLRIVQFYYYFNQEQLEDLQSPIAPQEGQELTPISRWLRDFSVEWGSFLDTPESTRYLESFKYAPEYDWQDFEKAPEEYESFNAFFARTFKDIDVQRPVARADDDRVIVFPVESTFVGQWTISTPVGEPLPTPASIVVKHIEWSIHELLADSKHAADFQGGLFCHSFLNTYDYHRQHAPAAGKVLEARFIPGQVYLEVDLETQGEEGASEDLAQAVVPRRFLDADDPTGYQFVQCRGLLVLESPIGKVAVLPMGMAQVSSVVFVEPRTEKPIVLAPKEKKELDYQQQVDLVNERIREALVGRELAKGDMFSYFQFGGSDCVMVFERRSNVDVTAKAGVHYPVRSQYAISNINM